MTRLLLLAVTMVFCVAGQSQAQPAGVTFETRNFMVCHVEIDCGSWGTEAHFDDVRPITPADYGLSSVAFDSTTINGYVIVSLMVEDYTQLSGWNFIRARFRVNGDYDQETFHIIVSSDDGKLKMYQESGGFAPGTVWVYPDDHVPFDGDIIYEYED